MSNMSPCACLLPCLIPSLALAAEPGDFDGDGRLSIADLTRLQDRLDQPPIDPEPGSWDSIVPWCGGAVSVLTYLEILRRGVPGSLPNPVALADAWKEDRTQPPLPVDERVLIRFESM